MLCTTVDKCRDKWDHASFWGCPTHLQHAMMQWPWNCGEWHLYLGCMHAWTTTLHGPTSTMVVQSWPSWGRGSKVLKFKLILESLPNLAVPDPSKNWNCIAQEFPSLKNWVFFVLEFYVLDACVCLQVLYFMKLNVWNLLDSSRRCKDCWREA